MIRFLKRKEINDTLWNKYIDSSHNGNVCAYSWMLDSFCPNWSAFVLDDYQALMPLPVKQKLGIKYLLQPLFIKTLNVYSNYPVNASTVSHFLENIPTSIKLIDLNLDVDFLPDVKSFQFAFKKYQKLDISLKYEEIVAGYSDNVLRNIKKANKAELKIVNNVAIDEIINMYKKNVGYKLKHIKPKDYLNLKKAMALLLSHKKAFSMGVIDKQGKYVASAFYLYHNQTISFFMGSSTDNGKKSGAMFLMFDNTFRRYATIAKSFDFEGSSIKSIADFNKKFGAKDYVYLQVKRNNLPLFLKRLKDPI